MSRVTLHPSLAPVRGHMGDVMTMASLSDSTPFGVASGYRPEPRFLNVLHWISRVPHLPPRRSWAVSPPVAGRQHSNPT